MSADVDIAYHGFVLIALATGVTFLITNVIESVTVAAILTVGFATVLYLTWIYYIG